MDGGMRKCIWVDGDRGSTQNCMGGGEMEFGGKGTWGSASRYGVPLEGKWGGVREAGEAWMGGRGRQGKGGRRREWGGEEGAGEVCGRVGKGGGGEWGRFGRVRRWGGS